MTIMKRNKLETGKGILENDNPEQEHLKKEIRKGYLANDNSGKETSDK